MSEQKAFLFNGKLKFYTHSVSYKQNGEIIKQNFYEEDKLNAYTQMLDERNIEYTTEEYEQPTQDVLNSVEGKTFNTIADAQAFLDGTLPKSDEERINNLELLVLQLGGVI